MVLAISRPAMVAKAVLANISAGKAPAVVKTALRYGYSFATAKTVQFKKSPDYQAVMQENKDAMIALGQKNHHLAQKQITKTIRKANARDSAYIADTMLKGVRLVSGESTDNIAVKAVAPIMADFGKLLEAVKAGKVGNDKQTENASVVGQN